MRICLSRPKTSAASSKVSSGDANAATLAATLVATFPPLILSLKRDVIRCRPAVAVFGGGSDTYINRDTASANPAAFNGIRLRRVAL